MGRTEDNFIFEVRDSKGSFSRLYEGSFRKEIASKKIIHIHWENIIYGSKYLLKSVFLLFINGSIILLLKRRNYKVVWTMHNFYGHDYPHPIIDSIGRKFMFAVADTIIIQQKQIADDMQIKYKDKKVVYMPIVNYIGAYGSRCSSNFDVRQKYGFSKDNIVLLSLGAIKQYKKFDSIIEVFNSLEGRIDKRIKFLIAGHGNDKYFSYIKRLAGHNDNIKIQCRFIEDREIADYLGIADYSIFWYDDSVLTSAGIDLSLSYGVPVIARNIPAADIIRNDINGFLYNNKEDLAEILLNLPRRTKISPENIIKTVADRSSENIAICLAKVYKEI